MAFEADCGSSTVLEEFRVASAVGSHETRPSTPVPRRLNAPRGGSKPVSVTQNSKLFRGMGGKSEIEIRNFKGKRGTLCIAAFNFATFSLPKGKLCEKIRIRLKRGSGDGGNNQ